MKNKRKKQLNQSDAVSYGSKPIQGVFQYYKTLYWMSAFLVGATTFLVYLPALKNGFVNWDDGAYVYENKVIRAIDIGFFKWAFTNEVAGLWHPLTIISYAFNFAVWGLDPWGYHLTNNLFHAFNSVFVFLLIIKVIQLNGAYEGKQKEALIVAFVTALLFGIHPLHVESVAWISERKDVLSAFFYLLSLLAYLAYASTINSRKHLYYGACLFFFVLALMSKPMAVSLPIVLLILDFYLLGHLTVTNLKAILFEKIPFFLLSLMASFVTIWAHRLESAIPTAEQITLFYRLLTAVHAYIFYMIKMILPLSLAPLYPLPPKIMLLSIEYLGSVIIWLINFLLFLVF